MEKKNISLHPSPIKEHGANLIDFSNQGVLHIEGIIQFVWGGGK